MSNDHDELQQLLANAKAAGRIPTQPKSPVETPSVKDEHRDIMEHCQWEVLPNGVFIATGTTKPKLVPGAYTVGLTESGRPLFISKKILTDTLIDLGDSNSARVVSGIKNFWTKGKRYAEKGLVYKRGVLLWGPAGSGKTATLAMLVESLIDMGGIVLLVQNPAFATKALPILRHIEPDRPLIVVLEDIEEIINNYGEHELLALLDGEHQTDNVVNLATTNYPENLGARIVNRPSRFDEVWKIGMPSSDARHAYLVHILGEDVTKYPVASWVRKTEGMSIAHLKELVVAVTCLDQDQESVIERLSKMKNAPRSTMYDKEVGFLGPTTASVMQTGNAANGW